MLERAAHIAECACNGRIRSARLPAQRRDDPGDRLPFVIDQPRFGQPHRAPTITIRKTRVATLHSHMRTAVLVCLRGSAVTAGPAAEKRVSATVMRFPARAIAGAARRDIKRPAARSNARRSQSGARSQTYPQIDRRRRDVGFVLLCFVAMVLAQARPVQEAPALLQTAIYAVLP